MDEPERGWADENAAGSQFWLFEFPSTGYPIDQKKEWKEKQRISEIHIQPGGDAVNQSIHMAALGFRPELERDGLLDFLKMVKQPKRMSEMQTQGKVVKAACRKLVFADLSADKLGIGLDGIRRFLPVCSQSSGNSVMNQD